MKRTFVTLFVVSLSAGTALAEQPRFAMKTGEALPPGVEATYADIRSTLGILPNFLKQYPPGSITGAWNTFKAVQLNPNTAIPPKYKELIGLAVASQIPCRFCTLFHTETAKFNGDSPAELNEAVAVAASARHWATFFSGVDVDPVQFRADTDKAMNNVRAKMNNPSQPPPSGELKTPADAYKDIEATLGFVPDFIRKYPPEGVAPAWEDVKSLEMSSNTALPPKIKSLISLSVSAQIPCPDCVYWDTQSAKLDGATDREINEAVTMAGLVRKWSTVINGINTDEPSFKKEMSQIMAHLNEEKKKQK